MLKINKEDIMGNKWYSLEKALNFQEIKNPYYIQEKTPKFDLLKTVHYKSPTIQRKKVSLKSAYVKKLKGMVKDIYRAHNFDFLQKEELLKELNKRMMEEAVAKSNMDSVIKNMKRNVIERAKAKHNMDRVIDEMKNRHFKKVMDAFGGEFKDRKSDGGRDV